MIDSTELLSKVDDFFKKFEPIYLKFIKQSQRIQRVRASKLSLSEIIFIAICYKCSQFNNFKAFFYSIPKNALMLLNTCLIINVLFI